MISGPEQLQNSVFSGFNINISHLEQDPECVDYHGYRFQSHQLNFLFRKSKITPKKAGQFVTLWKRNPVSRQTEPFTSEDPFNFYIIACDDNEKSGFFFFPKHLLMQKHMITSISREGKRGFRVYPTWDSPENKQAVKTQNWQKDFFVDFSDENDLEQFESILYQNRKKF